MPFYYRPSKPSKLDVEVASSVLAFCSSKLNMCIPKLLFVENTADEQASILKYDIDGAGFANPEAKTIYVAIPASPYSMIKTVAHECWHIYEGNNYSSLSETRANNFGEQIRREMLLKFDSLKECCGNARC